MAVMPSPSADLQPAANWCQQYCHCTASRWSVQRPPEMLKVCPLPSHTSSWHKPVRQTGTSHTRPFRLVWPLQQQELVGVGVI